jgi:OmpA-OmpF porin, OOP family
MTAGRRVWLIAQSAAANLQPGASKPNGTFTLCGGVMRFVPEIRRMFTVVVAACTLLAAGRASAQSVAQPKTWTVSPFLGSTLDVSGEGAGNSLAIGAAAGYDMTRNIGFEGEFSYLFDVTGDTAAIDWSITNFSGNFIYHFDLRDTRITPYGTFGLGFEHSSVDFDTDTRDDSASSTEISFNVGGGVKYPLTDKLLVRGDLRYFASNDLAPDFWRVYAGLTFVLGR